MKELLEALASARSPIDRCQFCNAPETTPVEQVMLNWHDARCPRLKAARILAERGTPLKMWRVQYQAQARNGHVSQREELVMRCEFSEQDALALVHRILEHQGNKRQLVPGSLRIEEPCIVPCE